VNLLQRNCPQCGRNNEKRARNAYSLEHWQLKNCSNCGFVYLENCPDYELLKVEFAWEKTSVKERQMRTQSEPFKQIVSDGCKQFKRKYLKRNKLKTLIERFFKPGNVLDVGCAAAGVLRQLDPQYTPFGIEISKSLAQKAKQYVEPKGGKIVYGDALSGVRQFADGLFSGIILSAFLEHEINPKVLLRELYRVASVNGVVIIKVPNYGCLNRKIRGRKWCGFRYPDHVNYFTPASIEAMCRDASWNILKFGFFDRHPLSDNMWLVISKK